MQPENNLLDPRNTNSRSQVTVDGITTQLGNVTPSNPDKSEPSSKWKKLFILQFVLTLITIVAPLALLFSVIGQTGSEFIAIGLIPVFFVGFLVAVANIALAIRYITKFKITRRARTLAIISVVVSIIFLIIPGLGAVRSVAYIYGNNGIKKLEREDQSRFAQLERSFAPHEISASEATDLINNCQITQFYTMPNAQLEATGEDADTASTGVLLVYSNSKPYRIDVSSRLADQFLPLAEAANKKCGLPYINSDN